MHSYSTSTIDYLLSLTTLGLTQVLSKLPPDRQVVALAQMRSRLTTETARDKDIERKRRERSKAAEVHFHECVNPQRRERCLADPERFLRTYFADRYKRAFDKDRTRIIELMWTLAQNKGRKAMAAPRGRGKTEIVKGMVVSIVLAGLVRFPFAGGQTLKHGFGIYTDVRNKFQYNDLLFDDFPEVCCPIRDMEGASGQRATKQHVGGVPTRIVWKANDYFSLPHVPGSIYGGVKMAFFGLDVAFRGKNIEGDRPDIIIVDDPETEESARSLEQIAKREKILNRDIAGLAEEGSEIAISVFTTVQNNYCLSARITDAKRMPAWGGERFGMIEKWPDTVEDATDESKLGLWSEYIALRHKDQADGDEHAMNAVAFYLANAEAMEAGAELITSTFEPKILEDGTQVTFSALQVQFNKIADTDLASYRTEYQNDPEKGEEVQKIRLTASRVQVRLSGLEQFDIPSDTAVRTIGLDLGKYASHWTDTAWSESGCIGTIPDYGIMETAGLSKESDEKAVETALIEAIEVWAEEVALPKQPNRVLIDSGTFTEAAYEVCRRLGDPFYPAKGWDMGRFRMPAQSDYKIPYIEAWAHYLLKSGVWLYNCQTEYWKHWLQERFLLRSLDDSGFRTPGSLALFSNEGDVKRHLSFAHHIVAEEERWIPKEGKELQRVWFVKNRNNHWLDSTALACAAAGTFGIKVVEQRRPDAPPVKAQPDTPPPGQFDRDGRPFFVGAR